MEIKNAYSKINMAERPYSKGQQLRGHELTRLPIIPFPVNLKKVILPKLILPTPLPKPKNQ